MAKLLEGIKVVEVALYAFVPSAGVVLGDWGAEVIKIEHPVTGDPIRGLAAFGVEPGAGGVTYLWEVFNRGKKSVGIDINKPSGLELLMQMVDKADVFITNFMEPARQRLGIDVDAIMARNPRIIYGRGTGQGPVGPDANKGGFDGISYWGRAGVSTAAIPPDYDYPISLPGPAFGDCQSGNNLAGGIAAALYHRERTGEGCVVDVSLFGSGMWAMGASIAGSYSIDVPQLPQLDRWLPRNPLANIYRTGDGRFLTLGMLESDRYWHRFCEVIERTELLDDPRFTDADLRYANVKEFVAILDEVFAAKTLAEWAVILDSQEGAWAPIQVTADVVNDEQALVNGYLQYVNYPNGSRLPVVPAPATFNREIPEVTPAPGHAANTDEVLLSMGLSWDELIELKLDGTIA